MFWKGLGWVRLKLGLIGYPIKYSLSPWIHKKLLQASGLKGTYDLYEIRPDTSLEEAIRLLKSSNVNGFNVTVPYKQCIIPYLDNIDPIAESVGAVNTVILNDGRLIGYNTDGIGFLNALKAVYPDVLSNDKRCLIIGAGGAARSIYVALNKQGMTHLDIVNRTKENAEEIALLGEKYTTTNVLSWKKAEDNLACYDILVQTTSIGMKPNNNEVVMSLDNLKEESIVNDIVYQPIHTTFLEQATIKEASILYGHRMLLYQAKAAFELWTDRNMKVEHLIKPLQHILEGR